MDHTKRQDPVCHIQTKCGPLSHRIVESIAVLTESGLRNTGMLSRERLSSDLRFFFQKCQTRKTYRMLFRERLTHSTGYHTTFCVPRTTAAANGAMLQSAKSSHECYENDWRAACIITGHAEKSFARSKFRLRRPDITISSNYDLQSYIPQGDNWVHIEQCHAYDQH